MEEILEGLDLMWKGMIIVFGFLFLLMVFMRLVPIISKNRLFNKKLVNNPGKKFESKNTQNNSKQTSQTVAEVPEAVVVAIAAAIFTHTGKKLKHLMIQSPTDTLEPYNIWSIAGRQDIMQSRDIVGQVGFQY